MVPIHRLQHELAFFVDDFGLAVMEMGGHGTGGSGDDIGVDGGVIVAELLCLGLGEFGHIAGVAFFVRSAEGDVGVALGAADVFVEEGLGHTARDAREAAISE